MFKKALLTAMVSLLFTSPSLAKPEYIQTPMPDWYKEGFTRGHLNIPLMMKQGFSRLEAIEIQNQMKDLLEAMPEYMELERDGTSTDLFHHRDTLVRKALAQAITQVKGQRQIESQFKPAPLKKGDFYVAFDFDETLMVHWYELGQKGPKYYDFKGLTLDYILRPELLSPDYVSLTPGWERAFTDLVAIPGCKGILIFTAKEDASAHAIIDRMRVDNTPLRQFVKGVFTRNHLVRDSKSVKPSKDLRIIDESLEHVILIDDNATRVFPEQFRNLREFPKYNADAYLKAKHDQPDPKVRSYFERLLPIVVDEIREAAAYSRQKNISFVEAYFPYSMEAANELIMLQRQGYSLQEATQMLRDHHWFEPRFFIPTPPKKSS
jgi:hypothetical protein